jgi:hypothetical protein
MVESLRQMMETPRAEMTMAKHACAARDEAQQLTDDFLALCATTSVPTPALHRLVAYIDPATPPMAEGSAKIPLVGLEPARAELASG